MEDIKKYIKTKQALIEKELKRVLPKDNSILARAMRHSALASGKRLRAMLVFSSAHAIGANEDKTVSIASAIELIHTFSLIHDDLPAMDDSDMRRGKYSSHIKFDEATAILAADALFALAYEILGKINNIDPRTLLKIITGISSSVGARGMCLGQSLDIQSEGKKISLYKLKGIHEKKTGALISACVYCGAVAGGANKAQLKALEKFASHIGLSFQIKDDILDVTGSSKVLGKTAGSDKTNLKATYPVILGLKKSEDLLENEYQSALNLIKGFGKKAEPLRKIAEYVVRRNK